MCEIPILISFYSEYILGQGEYIEESPVIIGLPGVYLFTSTIIVLASQCT